MTALCTSRARAVRPSKVILGQELYDKLYETGYHENLELTHATFLVYELLDQRNFPNYTLNTVLDVGCSHGKAVQQLWKAGRNASGVDISQVTCELRSREEFILHSCRPLDGRWPSILQYSSA